MHRLGVFRDRSDTGAVACRARAPIQLSQLLADVATLAERLPPGRHLLNLAADRYAFIVGFLAAVATRRICLLPPTKAPTALTQLHDRYPDAVAFGEGDLAMDQLPSARFGAGL